ncbi:endonuclease domain-containing protein [Xanthobacter sp. AM11]|uniref:endonuclease domain-containing protein n=1 Tax=Xanthobacter sp. AM11 TaxID=3380643 RepID=UPI0039BFBEF8
MGGGNDLELVLAVARRHVRCFAGATIADLRIAAREPAATSLARLIDGRRVLLHSVEDGASPDAVFRAIVQSLADAAGALFPRWYDRRPGLASTDRDAAGTGLPAGDAAVCGASPTWLRRAEARVQAGQSPLPKGFAAIETARQLGLVLAPEGLTLVLAVGSHPSGALAPLAHLAPWLADSCDWAVGILFADHVPDDPAFDRIRHGLVRFGAAAAPSGDDTPAPVQPGGEPTVPGHTGPGPSGWLWPVAGQPHPLSPAEQRLARLLAGDEALNALFTFNVPVRTRAGSTYLVDLLWAEGRLVIEVDGYGPHSSRTAFARDRHRDYELSASRYRVLRLTHDEIMRRDTPALSKIHTLVALAGRGMAQAGGADDL